MSRKDSLSGRSGPTRPLRHGLASDDHMGLNALPEVEDVLSRVVGFRGVSVVIPAKNEEEFVVLTLRFKLHIELVYFQKKQL
jgi:hypothetical protein